MFGLNNKKSTEISRMSGHREPVNSHGLNSLVKGTTIEGSITAESDIRIDGVIKGSLKCKSKVIIGPSGRIEGDVECMNAVIEGTFEGNILVRELLDVRSTARISGDVKTQTLNLEKGAFFNVICKMDNGSNPGLDAKKSDNFAKARKGKGVGQEVPA